MTMDALKVFNMITEFIYTLATFCYNALFYQVTLFKQTFELWQIFSVIGVTTLVVVIIIKIFT